jgi:hypothetical protein
MWVLLALELLRSTSKKARKICGFMSKRLRFFNGEATQGTKGRRISAAFPSSRQSARKVRLAGLMWRWRCCTK